MFKKIGVLIEAHIEKIILIVVGLLCSWLLVTRVLLSPNVVVYNDKTYSPTAIDQKIYEDAKNKITNRGANPGIIGPNIPETPVFAEKLENPLKNVSIDIPLLTPQESDKIDKPSNFKKPVIGKVTEVDRELIRAAVYEPLVPVTREHPYEDKECEPNDVDFVTVSAKFDFAKQYDEFYKNYVDMVPDEFVDVNAKPVVAGVKLQRQQQNPDGTWPDEWQDVPKPKIDYNRDLFKLIGNSSELPLGGSQIIKLQLNHTITQLELLQPEPYQIASSSEQWFPPKHHREFLSAQKKDEQTAKKEAVSSESTRPNETSNRRGRGDASSGGIGQSLSSQGGMTSTTRGSRRGGGSRGSGTTNPVDTTGSGTTTGRRGSRTGRSTTNQPDRSPNTTGQTELQVDKVYDDFEAMVLTAKTDLSKMTEPVLFWAFDDTVKPEQTYRYQIQIGFLNPVATENGDDLVFWSEPSDITSPVSVPGKIYFFPRAVQEAAKTVTVSIYKLDLGYWYKEDFKVAQGEMIGDVAEIKSKETDSEKKSNTNTKITSDSQDVQTIDFNTGAIMVDVVPISAWSGDRSLGLKQYHDMMYSYDGTDIRHMPVTSNTSIWTEEMKRANAYVQTLINIKKEPLNAWGSSELQVQLVRGDQYQGRTPRQ